MEANVNVNVNVKLMLSNIYEHPCGGQMVLVVLSHCFQKTSPVPEDD